jgi:hypothetical protein
MQAGAKSVRYGGLPNKAVAWAINYTVAHEGTSEAAHDPVLTTGDRGNF